MFISHKYRFIFIKTRKTAGSSLEKFFLDIHNNDKEYVFGGMPPEHLLPINCVGDVEHKGWKWIEKHFPNEWKNYYKFTVERNSWDKVVSIYFWQRYYGPWKIKPFNEYIKTQKKLFNRKCWSLYTDDNNLKVDNVIQFGNLHNNFKKIARNIGIPYTNELLNIKLKTSQRDNQNYQEMYNEETKKLVGKSYKSVIDFFQYTF